MDDMIEEFILEAQEIFEESEVALLNLDKGEEFQPNYNALFRAFHSLKGAAGMFGMLELQAHMHYLENLLDSNKESLDMDLLDYFFRGVDAAKEIMAGNTVEFGKFQESGSIDSSESVEGGESEAPVDSKQEVEEKVEPEVEHSADETKTEHVERIEKAKSDTKDRRDLNEKAGLIYVVDDEKELLEFCQFLLEDENFAVETFSNPNDLFAKLDEGHPDAIVSDFKMPEMTGVELMSKVHHNHPLLPVVLVSGYLTKEICMESIALGAQGILEKPFNEEQFTNTVKNVVRRYQAIKLLNRSINLMMYQYSDLNQYLVESGKENLRDVIKDEMKQIMSSKKIVFG